MAGGEPRPGCCCCFVGGLCACACAPWQNQAVARALTHMLPGSQHLSRHTASAHWLPQLPEVPPHCWPTPSDTLQPAGAATPGSCTMGGEGSGKHCQ
jgi:hypothetical protein